jgi:two-component system KDP operon response regulator KdpE
MRPTKPTALIIDDEVQIRRLLHAVLERAGYHVEETGSGKLGVSEVALKKPDVVILDLGLPDMDGAEVLRRIREWSRVPVLVASVRDGAAEKIAALDCGADDYVTKPFDNAELLARLRAIQRRADPGHEAVQFTAGDLKMDFVARTVEVMGREVRLTPIQYALLRILALNAGKVVTQGHLLSAVWGENSEGQSQHLRVHLSHLRRKLAVAGFDTRCLRNEPAIGYRLINGER